MKRVVLSVLIGTLISTAWAYDSAIRLNCAEDSKGAKIYLNGELKGESPIDLLVDAGLLKITAVKAVGPDHERRWEKQVQVVAGAPLRLTVELGPTRLTRDAIARRDLATFKSAQAKAESGDVAGMQELASCYLKGIGTGKDGKKAQEWIDKAAATRFANTKAKADKGDTNAMLQLATYYEEGYSVPKNPTKGREIREEVAHIKNKNRAERDLVAANAGNKEAIKRIIPRYRTGDILPQDDQLADAWQQKLEAHQKADEIQEKLNNPRMRYDYFIDDFSRNHNRSAPPLLLTGVFITGPSLWDTVLSPFRVTYKGVRKRQLKKAKAVAWANPEAMVAQAAESESK